MTKILVQVVASRRYDILVYSLIDLADLFTQGTEFRGSCQQLGRMRPRGGLSPVLVLRII